MTAPNNPIQHVVIIFKENHTFDNYFGTFPGANGTTGLAQAPDVPPIDPPHSHETWLQSLQQGSGLQEQYQAPDIPAYWAFAQQYTLCDNYFTDVASQSEPNHLFAIAADSPIIDNATAGRHYQPQPPFDTPSLPATLAGANLTWRNYADPHSSYFESITALKGDPSNVKSATFDGDAAGNLPTVAWLFAPEGFSDHPGRRSSVKQGMQWTADRVQAIATGPLWPSTAIFITWDDWGGWFDHVPPPKNSQSAGGENARTPGYTGSQFRYGPRVPLLVISPFAKQGINSSFASHASLVKFCLRNFGLPAWNVPALAANDPSGDLWDCFDFTALPRLAVPSPVPNP